MAKRKRQKDNDLQNTVQKTEDRATQTPTKNGRTQTPTKNGRKQLNTVMCHISVPTQNFYCIFHINTHFFKKLS